MAFAGQRWGNDEVIIHTGGRHTANIIAHAVAHGLNIANRDAYSQALVAQERERHAQLSAKRDRSAGAGVTIAVIARAHPARRSR